MQDEDGSHIYIDAYVVAMLTLVLSGCNSGNYVVLGMMCNPFIMSMLIMSDEVEFGDTLVRLCLLPIRDIHARGIGYYHRFWLQIDATLNISAK